MSSSSIESENLNRSIEEEKEQPEQDSCHSSDDEFLETAEKTRKDAPIDLNLDKAVKDAETTFIIGPTGSGKSTLGCLLEGSLRGAQSDETETCWLFSGDARSKIVISNTTSSCTELPTRFLGTDGKSVYYDNPGFFDNRGKAKEIACSFYLKTLIERTETFRIILTIEYHAFERVRDQELIELVDYIEGLFPDIDLLLKALFVVVTKVTERGTIKGIQAKAKQFATEAKKLSTRTKSILLWLADPSQADIIEIFRQPNLEGEIDKLTLQNILSKLERVPFVEPHAITFHIPKSTGYYITKLTNRFQNKMNIQVQKMIQKIEEICQRKIYEGTFEELITFILSAKGHIVANTMSYQEGKNLRDFLYMLCSYAERINSHCLSPIKPLKIENLKKVAYSLTALKELIPKTEFNVTFWCYQFAALKDRISRIIEFNYTEETEEKEEEGAKKILKILKIKGIAINAKKIEALLKEDFNSIEIYCLSAIFFDQVKLTCKGVNVSIIAPLWRIDGNNEIDISGKDGLPYSQKDYYYFDGRPGNPGGNAGNFLGISDKYAFNGELKISANGGKGGPGENGLNEWEKMDNMIEALNISQPKVIIKRGGIEAIDLEARHEINQNTNGKGGKGGHGGRGGNPGTVDLTDQMNNMLKMIIEKNPGDNGENGKPGEKTVRKEQSPVVLKKKVKSEKESVPILLMAVQHCCGVINVSDGPRPSATRPKSAELMREDNNNAEASTGITALIRRKSSRLILDNPEEINSEGLIEPSPNNFNFELNRVDLKETQNRYFKEAVGAEGMQAIIGKNPFGNI